MIQILKNGFDEQEQQLRDFLDGQLVENIEGAEAFLKFEKNGLSLQVLDGKKYVPLQVDFLEPNLQRRINWKQLKSELILKACNVIKDKNSTVLDATAGFGVDSFLLAAAGAKVTMLERSPLMYSLLCDGLKRMDQYQHGLSLEVNYQDAIQYLLQCQNNFDVIYLDPMHPERRSAAVSQPLKLLRGLVGEDVDFQKLFESARSKANQRIVVKWPIKAETILPPADFSYEGRSIRFDCYKS